MISLSKNNIAMCFIVMICMLPNAVNAGSVYHAASKSVVRRIITKGVNPSKFNSQARYGRMFYIAKRPSTALAEKGQRSQLIRMRSSRGLVNNSWDLRKPTPHRLRKYTGNTDLRGTVKRGIVGPKLGQKIGKLADRQKKAILYRSAKNGGTNVAVSRSLMEKHPRLLSQRTIYQR
jgi:hypothetical protein